MTIQATRYVFIYALCMHVQGPLHGTTFHFKRGSFVNIGLQLRQGLSRGHKIGDWEPTKPRMQKQGLGGALLLCNISF